MSFHVKQFLLLRPQDRHGLSQVLAPVPFGRCARQDGMDDLRDKQRQPQHPRHVSVILANNVGQFTDVGNPSLVDQGLPAGREYYGL